MRVRVSTYISVCDMNQANGGRRYGMNFTVCTLANVHIVFIILFTVTFLSF